MQIQAKYRPFEKELKRISGVMEQLDIYEKEQLFECEKTYKGYDFSNAKLFARTKFYFDCTVCEFFFTATSSVKKHVLDVIELIKK